MSAAAGSSGAAAVTVANKTSFIEFSQFRFLITGERRLWGHPCTCDAPVACETGARTIASDHIADAPTEANLEAYLREYKSLNVTDLVRCCECRYSTDRLIKSGIKVHDMPWPDGDPPPSSSVIASWLKLCDATFAGGNGAKKTIAVHCVAGLGRAPILVAIALVEGGLAPLDAVSAIRAKRRGAINAKQLTWLEHSYKTRAAAGGCCTVS